MKCQQLGNSFLRCKNNTLVREETDLELMAFRENALVILYTHATLC